MSDAPTPSARASRPARTDDGREHFDRAEFTRVLDHYDIGKVRSVRELIAGSPVAPKAVVECGRGTLVLKRRAPGLEHASVVGYAHEIILGCLERGVCVPPIIGTKDSNNSMCQIADRTYELFVYIEGTPYDRSSPQARSSGALLGELHSATDSIETTFEPVREPAPIDPSRAEHRALDAQAKRDAKRILDFALESHHMNARDAGVVHGDWHPGNMVYRGAEIVAACDFDNTRVGSRDRELAQALVYFSMRRASDKSDAPDEGALGAFWSGYASTSPTPAPPRLIAAMMPAVILDEALAAPTLSGELSALALRRARWLDEHTNEIQRILSAS